MTKTKVTIKKLPKSKVEISGEAEAEHFSSYWKKAIEKLGSDVEIAGFRKGHVPEALLLSRLPEIAVLEEMAQMLLADSYGDILEEHKIDAIGRPEINITKIAKGNPLGFTITTTVVPDITLPDYKKIAAKNRVKEEPVVSDEDMEKALIDIRKMRGSAEKADAHKKLHDENIPHDHESEMKKTSEEADLPAFNDAFVKSLGAFENVEDFKKKLKENLLYEKEREIKDKNRIAIIEAILKETLADVPELLIESELMKLMSRLTEDITRLGLKLEDYLKQVNKTEEEIKKEWQPDAEKRAKLELVIDAIAKKESLVPDPALVYEELAHLMKQHKDADPIRAQLYVESILRNEKVFQFLEKQKQ